MKNGDHNTFRANPGEVLRRKIEDFVANSSQNRFPTPDGSPIFEAPLVGFASGSDPLFDQYKAVVGEFHLTPAEALSQHTGKSYGPDEVSVIAWALPIAHRTRESNRRETTRPSRLWAATMTYGTPFSHRLREHVLGYLAGVGIPAVGPAGAPFFKRLDLANGEASNWSERHILHAAGLGTFSLSDGLITAKGIAMRCGSVVAAMPLEPTPRTYTSHVQNCLFFHNRACAKCIRRCPAGAVTEAGHDKLKCQQYYRTALELVRKEYGVANAGCGLCQTAVPCEARIPSVRRELAQAAH